MLHVQFVWQLFIHFFIYFSDYDSDDRYAVSHNENDNPDEDYIDKSGGREGGDNRGKNTFFKNILNWHFDQKLFWPTARKKLF